LLRRISYVGAGSEAAREAAALWDFIEGFVFGRDAAGPRA
jgi:hypothetical protein